MYRDKRTGSPSTRSSERKGVTGSDELAQEAPPGSHEGRPRGTPGGLFSEHRETAAGEAPVLSSARSLRKKTAAQPLLIYRVSSSYHLPHGVRELGHILTAL